MPMQRGAALLLAAFAGVVDGGILCANDGDFDGAAMVPGANVQCMMLVSMYLPAYAGLDAVTAEQCNATIVPGGGPGGSDITLRDGLKYMIFCCSGQPTAEACGPLFPPEMNPCASASDFDPFAGIGEGYCNGDEDIMNQQTCESAGYPEAWDPTEEEFCDVGRIDADVSVRQMACSTLGGTWEVTSCFQMMMGLSPNLTFSESTCSVRHPNFGNLSTTMVLEYLGGSCCGSPENKNDVCDPFRDVGMPNPCYNRADFNPYAPINPSEPEGAVCAQYITMAFQDAYNTTSPPVLCNFTTAECTRDLYPTFSSEPGQVSVATLLGYLGQLCCGGGAPTLVCSPMQGEMPCEGGGNTSRPHNVTCHDIQMFHEEHHCCRNTSRTCAEVKMHYRAHACCGMPSKYVPAPRAMMH